MDQSLMRLFTPSWHGGVGPQAPSHEASASASSTFARPEDEDSEEWEYEYSTTEKETYYVTLDLTNPDFVKPRTVSDKSTRSLTRWTNPGIGRHKRPNAEAPVFKAKTFTIDPEGDENQEEREEVAEPAAPAPDEPPKPKPVQILELHSDNPIISYDGHVYSCQWAKNLGTELLFTASEGNPHPCVTTVPGNVDILAASSARIISKIIEIQPRAPITRPVAAPKRRRKGFIKLGSGSSARRKDQAAFLEQLIQIKERKGEEDMVTVVAQKRKLVKAWREEIKSRRQQERTRLNKVVSKGGDEAVDALQKLSQLDEAERKMLEAEKMMVESKRRPTRRPGRPPKSGISGETVRRGKMGKGKGKEKEVEGSRSTITAAKSSTSKGKRRVSRQETGDLDDEETAQGFVGSDDDDAMDEDGPEEEERAAAVVGNDDGNDDVEMYE